MNKEKGQLPSNKLPEYIWALVSKNGDIILDIFLYEPYVDEIEGKFNYVKKIKIKEVK